MDASNARKFIYLEDMKKHCGYKPGFAFLEIFFGGGLSKRFFRDYVLCFLGFLSKSKEGE